MRRILLSLSLLLLALSPAVNAQTVSVPNTLNDGSVADADAMNENFTELEVGINAALTSGPVSLVYTFTNGTTADADEVNANFTAVVDGVNTALANRATDCAGAGGTWDAGTSTCTAGYNCFVGAFCTVTAVYLPPAAYEYTNVYDGHTQGAGAALAAGCDSSSGDQSWTAGVEGASFFAPYFGWPFPVEALSLPPHIPDPFGHMCQ